MVPLLTAGNGGTMILSRACETPQRETDHPQETDNMSTTTLRTLPTLHSEREPMYQLRTALYALALNGEVECSSDENAQDLRALYHAVFPAGPSLLTADCDGVITVQTDAAALQWDKLVTAEVIAASERLYAEGEICLGKCMWFARCAAPAVQLVQHPVLGGVPCCARHVAFATGK